MSRIRTALPILFMLASLPIFIWGAVSVPSNTADIAQWLPDGNDKKEQYNRFVETFGADNFVLVSWPGCVLGDKRIDTFARVIEQRANASNSGPHPLVRRVFTPHAVLAQLTGEPLSLSREVALRRMQGTLVGPDGVTSCILVQLASTERPDQHAMVDMIYDIAPECGVAEDDVRLGGTAYKAVMIERKSEGSLRRFSVPSCLVALLVAWCCLRSVRLTSMILAGAVFAELLSLALVYYTGGQMNAVMIVMPPLVFVLTVSGSVHLINYYRDAIRERGVSCAATRALKMGWLPCTLAAVTTAIGLVSLGVSAISPVRTFGIYAGIALLASLVAVLTYLPAALRTWPSRKKADDFQSGADRHLEARRRAGQLSGWLCQRHGVLAAASLAIIVLLGAGLARVTTSVKLERSFRDSSRFVRDYRWIEDHIGPLISVETLVRFDRECPLTILERMELVARLHMNVSSLENAGGVLSPATFSPSIPRPGGLRGTARRAVVSRKLSEQRDAFVDRGLIADDGEDEVWRLSARAPAMGDMDYGSFVQKLRRPVDSVVNDYRAAGVDGINVSYTGFSPLIDKAQQQLLDDLVGSFLLACLLICPIMMIVVRSFWGGLLAMVPNVFPIVCVFGALGWLGISIDIGTMLTASIALGIAVDNTLHFLTWYRRGLTDGMTRIAAVRNAYQRCSAAMIQTTLICGLGLLVFAFSSYTPASRFAWLIAVLLLSALGGSLVLLPAILAGPLGRAVEPHPWFVVRWGLRYLPRPA
jgi:predicted RND superfamily exporter protein